MMAEALRGGEEADHADHVRWASLRMLAMANSKPDSSDEGALFRGLARDIQNGKFESLGAPATCLTQIDAILHVLEPFERFYQGVTFFFERIRGAASDEAEARLIDVASAAVGQRSCRGNPQKRGRVAEESADGP